MDKEIKEVLEALEQAKSFLNIYQDRQSPFDQFNQDLHACENWLDLAIEKLKKFV